MSKCKSGYYYCYTDKKCKPISKGMKVTARFSGGGKEPEEVGIDKPLNGNDTNGNGNGNGSTNGGVSEGTLHKWFKGSKSKDGKGGWVNVVTGGTCASDEPGEGTPKCVSSAKRASMSKAERLSAQRRKKKADPGQQAKSGAAKPTYVSTDPKKKMKKEEVEVMGENVSSGKSRIAKSGRVKGKVVGAVSNTEKHKERQHEKAKDTSAGEAAYKEASAKGLSPAEALFRKKRAERNAARERIKSKEKKEKERLKGGRFGRIREEVEVTEVKDKKGKGSGTKDAC